MQEQHTMVVLVTGASSGIGKLCAEQLCQSGYRVYGTSRRPCADLPYSMIRMDVHDQDSVEKGVAEILDREGRLDALVNNAGVGIAGAVEETSLQEAQAQLETNFFGVLRVCRAALPAMRKQRFGYVINISSMAAQISLPFQGLYSASKAAVEALSEALSIEVRPFGIRVAVIEPGDYATSFTNSRRRTAESLTSPVYQARLERALGVMEHDETSGGPPLAVARTVERILRSPNPRLRYRAGPAFERLAIHLKKVLPSRWFEWIIAKYYRLA